MSDVVFIGLVTIVDSSTHNFGIIFAIHGKSGWL